MNEKKSNIISKGLTIIILAILIGNAALKDYESMKNRPTTLIEELSNEDSLSFSVINDSFGNNKALLISSNDSTRQLTEEEYDLLNRLINNEDISIDELNLVGLSRQIDFSKLDLSSIENVNFTRVADDFDYSTFSNLGLRNLSFSNINFTDSLKSFLDSATLDFCDVHLSSDGHEIASYLADTEKSLAEISLSTFDEDFDFQNILSTLPTQRVELDYYYDSNHQPVDIHLDFSNSVREVNLEFHSIVETQNISLGDVYISSNNADFEVYFVDDDEEMTVDINSDTRFSLPDQAYVSFENITCSNMPIPISIEKNATIVPIYGIISNAHSAIVINTKTIGNFIPLLLLHNIAENAIAVIAFAMNSNNI